MTIPSVLIVDDERHVNHVVRYKLEQSGLHVWEARNGQEGFDLALKELPDVIVTDFQMPVLSGFDTDGDGNVDQAGSTQFTVDRKVDLTVTRQDGAEVTGAVGSTNAVTFSVSNDSNEALRFVLSAANTTGDANPFGGNADSVDAS